MTAGNGWTYIARMETTKRWFCFETANRLYIGKCYTTEAEIRLALYCSIEGNTVIVYGVVRS